MSGNVIDARKQFIGLNQDTESLKQLPFAPNLQYLRDLCSGICRTCSTDAPPDVHASPPAATVKQLTEALHRNVRGICSVSVSPAESSRWSIHFTTKDDGGAYSYGFLIESRWLGASEKSASPLA